MAVAWRIDLAESALVLTSDENASFDEWTAAVNAAALAPEWRRGLRVIHDARRMARIPSQAEAQSRGLFVLRRSKALGIERWAAVVPERVAERDAYWLAAVFADREGIWCRMFTNLEGAWTWIRSASPGNDERLVTPSSVRTVLLVDDARVLRTMLSEQLKDLGYAVVVAASGDEAIRLAQGHDGPIHVLLTDVHMPGLTGLELAQRLRSLNPDIRVVFMSGTGGTVPSGKVLVKPFTQEQLAKAILEALARPA